MVMGTPSGEMMIGNAREAGDLVVLRKNGRLKEEHFLLKGGFPATGLQITGVLNSGCYYVGFPDGGLLGIEETDIDHAATAALKVSRRNYFVGDEVGLSFRSEGKFKGLHHIFMTQVWSQLGVYANSIHMPATIKAITEKGYKVMLSDGMHLNIEESDIDMDYTKALKRMQVSAQFNPAYN
jgi:hypothetical protein